MDPSKTERTKSSVCYKIVCKGKCPVCGKRLGTEENIFICNDCLRKVKENSNEQN